VEVHFDERLGAEQAKVFFRAPLDDAEYRSARLFAEGAFRTLGPSKRQAHRALGFLIGAREPHALVELHLEVRTEKALHLHRTLGRQLMARSIDMRLEGHPALAELAQNVDRAARARLGRSLSIRHVDAGSCNGCELEIHAIGNAFYDLERFGLRFVASPRHADVLMVTGPVTKNMEEALMRTYNATPDPKWVIALGACAVDGGIFAGSYACIGGVSDVVPVDLHIRGCPPSPNEILKGLVALLEHVTK